MLNAPQNGTISCLSGQVTGSLCSFSCNTGFTLIGSSRRVCRTTTIWSGTPTFCRPLQCVPLEPPENGVILAPCRRDYTSSCSILCTFGYTIDGPAVQTCVLDSQTGTVQWTEPPMCNGELPPSMITTMYTPIISVSCSTEARLAATTTHLSVDQIICWKWCINQQNPSKQKM